MKQYCYSYPRPEVTVDCVALAPGDRGMSVLLIERGREPFQGKWALPGGFMNMDEDAETACRRELKEETGIEAGQMMQLGAYTNPQRDPRGRVVSIAYMAYLPKIVPAEARDDAKRAQWFPLDALPELAFDHAHMIRDVRELMLHP